MENDKEEHNGEEDYLDWLRDLDEKLEEEGWDDAAIIEFWACYDEAFKPYC